jgi:hypothetical protein
MKKAAIVIDWWKLPIFERHLKPYVYTVQDGLTADSLLISVETENLEALGGVVIAAQAEAERTKGAIC